ncbi:hypothetical protein [Spirosoma sordidisoli]|uniref:Uncharacterized protein n=1 Tax=Spirosoma sordidisoli TaxID=2502893 RepID=A0A4V1RVM6_9BACT|nr:hypothetical protein [Spirosoma sordidisoli]RYC67298.1 hypothetical protein EQG79_24590 [Spirosoma sordidisoli]
MTTFLFLLLLFPAGQPSLIRDTPPRVDSTFLVQLDKAHTAVIRRYIKANQRHGLQKDTTVISIAISNKYNNPDYHEIQIGATKSREGLRAEIPAYLSEVDGYSIAIYFDWYQTSPGIVYPKSYIKKFEQVVAKLRLEKHSPYPIDHCENWRVIFKQGEEPDIKILL